MLERFSKTGWHWLWVSVLVLGIDHATKHLALHFLDPYQPLVILPVFNLTLAFNKGAAFSFLSDASGWQGYLFGGLAIVVSIGILYWLNKLQAKQRWMDIALSLILGGALGNLWDRMSHGFVIDFIQFHLSHFYYPAFNMADSAICIGAFMILWDVFFGHKKEW